MYDVSLGTLTMINPEDKIIIKGNYTNNVIGNTQSKMTDGTIELKGDFTLKDNASDNLFCGRQNNTIIFNGDKKQTVHKTNPKRL